MKTISTITAGMTGSEFLAALNNNASVSDVGITVGSSDITTKVFDYVCDGVSDQVQINAAIAVAAALTNGGCVFLSPGKFNISARVIIKSNVRLISTPQTTIFLSDASDDYLLVNDEFELGTTDFSVIGGTWNANSANQTRTYTGGNPSLTYYGFGFLFKNAQRFLIQDVYLYRSLSWGMAHFLCSDAIFRNIQFTQPTATLCDGITGFGAQRMLIENVHGYTGDDMIAFASLSTFFGIFGGVKIEWGVGRDTQDIVIRNIRAQASLINGTETYTSIGIYAGEGMTTENILIDGVTGKNNVGLAFIHVKNFWPTEPGKGYVKNLDVKNINVESTKADQGVIEFSDFDIMEVDNFNISNVRYINNFDALQTMIKLNGSVKKANISDVSAQNLLGVNKHKLISVNGTGQAITINASGIDRTSDLEPVIENAGVSTGLRINAPDCYAGVLAQVNAAVLGDRLVEEATGHPMLYTTKWIDVVDGTDI